jgi:hypothetical protein
MKLADYSLPNCAFLFSFFKLSYISERSQWLRVLRGVLRHWDRGFEPTGGINVCPRFFSACIGLVGRMSCDEPIPIQRGYHMSKKITSYFRIATGQRAYSVKVMEILYRAVQHVGLCFRWTCLLALPHRAGWSGSDAPHSFASNLGRDWGFSWLPSVLAGKSREGTSITSRWFPFKFSPIHHSLVTLPFDGM